MNQVLETFDKDCSKFYERIQQMQTRERTDSDAASNDCPAPSSLNIKFSAGEKKRALTQFNIPLQQRSAKTTCKNQHYNNFAKRDPKASQHELVFFSQQQRQIEPSFQSSVHEEVIKGP